MYIKHKYHKLTGQVANKFHPHLYKIGILHKHLGNGFVRQDIDKITDNWPVAVIDEGFVLAIHNLMFWVNICIKQWHHAIKL